jgi:2-dehydro-3-deoxyphosphogluconate aldolase / (4S)-4-hydroxy-2-oxoglutarate aldolase
MAQFKRIQVINKILETGMVPIFYHHDIEVVTNIIKACYEGGIRVIEYTNRGDYAHETFSLISKFVRHELPGMMLGIGTVVDAATAALYIQLGANLIVSPVLKEDLAVVCNRRKILWIPGCATLTEISRAEELGAEIVKVFPAKEVGGAKFVANIKGPCPWTSIMATGGVEPTDENLKEWFTAGVACVGMGSQLITKEIIEKKDYIKLTSKCAEALSIIQKYKTY